MCEVTLLYEVHYIITTAGNASTRKVRRIGEASGWALISHQLHFPRSWRFTKKQTKGPNKNSLHWKEGRNKSQLAFQQQLCLFSVLDEHAAYCHGLLKTRQYLEVLHRLMMHLTVEPCCGLQEEELAELHKETVLPQVRQMV